ncbi:hypothetical protein E2P30_00795 [Candidatus Bathyarchaeota archaeon]|nr:hypothetical protein E2P30_00795 [Candidatus Bathyarchaeota archaeon]
MLHKTTLLHRIAFLIIFTIFCSLAFVNAQSDLIMVHGNSIADQDIDGVIGAEWDDVTSYTNVPISPIGNAQIWLKHDLTHLYIAVQFEGDSDNLWVAVQLGNPNCMTDDTDGALFGHDELSPDGYQDINFGGFGVIRSDISQDGVGAMQISLNSTVIELKKPLNTQDLEGNDIQWSEDKSYDIIIMWDSNGGGSSGGSISHNRVSPKPKTIYLQAQTTPSPTSTPKSTPTQTPTPTIFDPTTLIAIVAVVLIASSIFIYLIKRKKKTEGN